MDIIEEILFESEKLNIKANLLDKLESISYIKEVINKFNVQKDSGHLAINSESISLPTEDFEFIYTKYLVKEEGFIFFDQKGPRRNTVICIEDCTKIGDILINCPGIEYFLSNNKKDYLIAVNWYVIEGAGATIEWMSKIINT